MEKPLSDDQIRSLYLLWLQSVPLRRIAKIARQWTNRELSHTTISKYFSRVFGVGSTDPVRMSLARSLVEDNPNDPEVLEYALQLVPILVSSDEPEKYRSLHSLQQLGRYQVVKDFDLLPYLAIHNDVALEDIDCLDFLRLPLFYTLVLTLVYQLGRIVSS